MQEIREQNVDEADFRRQMMMTTISVFTFVAFIKCSQALTVTGICGWALWTPSSQLGRPARPPIAPRSLFSAVRSHTKGDGRIAEGAMFGHFVRHPFLVAIAGLACAVTGNAKNLCDNTPDEPTMLQVLKPVAKSIFLCIDEVLLTYKVRGEFASARNLCSLQTKEGRNESIECLIQYVEPRTPPDLPTAGQEPRELVAPFLRCFLRRVELPLENEKRANAVFHWFFEIVRP
ncbi:hypothetical protein V5799_008873 [Amblyomma americanum]|uniref:Uncharacterized protein n=1 Tax=Amblyomma americanum TaxID=6943 RepID=A0AAQ4FC67_AMBAM